LKFRLFYAVNFFSLRNWQPKLKNICGVVEMKKNIKINSKSMIILIVLSLIINSCSLHKKLSHRYIADGYITKQFNFLKSKPVLDILIFNHNFYKNANDSTTVQDCKLLVIRDTFKEILYKFIPENNFEEKPTGFALYIPGFITLKDGINYEDVKAITVVFTKNDGTYLRDFLKDDFNGEFIQISKPGCIVDSVHNNYFHFSTNLFVPKIKNNLYSAIMVLDWDDPVPQSKPSWRACKVTDGEYKNISFNFLKSKPQLEILCHLHDSIQRCELILRHDLFEETTRNFVKYFKSPFSIVLHISGLVDNKNEINVNDVQAVTTFEIENHHIFQRFFLRAKYNNQFWEVPEMLCEIDSIKLDYTMLTTQYLVPDLNNTFASVLLINDGININESVINEKNDFMEKFNNYLKESRK
jgi:hypothetical protein